jgi:hypothetical protein
MKRLRSRGSLTGAVLAAAALVLGVGGQRWVAAAGAKRVIHLVSLSSSGAQATGGGVGFVAVSANGRFVAFGSTATNLVPNDTNAQGDVFVRDRVTGTTERVSVSSAGAQATGGLSGAPSISADGRFVAFSSAATNLVANDTNAAIDLFVRDRTNGTTERVSVASDGTPGNAGSFVSSISADGRFVAFSSDASNLVAGDTNAAEDIFVRDRTNNVTQRVSVATDGTQGNGRSDIPSVSADARFVVYFSDATNLVGGDTNTTRDIFLRDRTFNTTIRLNVSSAGVQAANNLASDIPSISADGRYAAFQSFAGNLVPDDTNTALDVFVRDLLTNTTERVSVSSDDAQASGEVPAISGDGTHVIFRSAATNLVPGDTNGQTDVFVRNRIAGTTVRVNVSPTGDAANAGFAADPVRMMALSADGLFAVFLSDATNLVPIDTNSLSDVFVAARVNIPSTRIAIFRPATREWFARDDDGSTSFVQFGGPGDQGVPADYLGSGNAEIAIFRPSNQNWFIRANEGNTIGPIPFGGPGDIPVPADYLGTGRAQIAVWRPSTGDWFIRNEDGTPTVIRFIGAPGDIPVPADYFGDGKASLAIFSPTSREWFLRRANGTSVIVTYGGPGDKPVPGDYFGIGRDSLAIFRPSTGEWYLRHDNGETTRIPFGGPGDTPVPGDYLEEGRLQLAVFRGGVRDWFIRTGNFGVISINYGGPGDVPIPVPFRPRF